MFNKEEVRINRRIIKDIYGNVFPVYGFEYLNDLGYWVERYNFTNKLEYEIHMKTFKLKYIKIGDWKTRCDL